MKTILSHADIEIGTILGARNTLSPLSMAIGKAEAEYGGMIGRRARMISTHSLCVAEVTKKALSLFPKLENDYKVGDLVGIEATYPKCRVVDLSHYENSDMRNHYCYAANIPGSSSYERHINDFLWSLVGKKYELKVFVKMIFAPWMKLSAHDWYCSETVYGRILVQKNYIAPLEWKQGVTPWDIQRHCEAAYLVTQRFYKKSMLFPV